jgi:uncharacterized protein involved in type VI secretion and phage assembly
MRTLTGLSSAIVLDNVDPNHSGRVKVRLPPRIPSGHADVEIWARVATLMAGNDRGTWFLPDINDEVLVAFQEGNTTQAYVIGCLWSSANPPPETMSTDNSLKVLRSRNGVKLTLDDQSGQERFVVETPGGQKVTLKDGPGCIEIRDSNGNSVALDANGITITSSAKVSITASQVQVAAGMLTVDAGISKFSGVVQCDTLITNSVISASYSPGAGNIS